jgi:hypothetical protein
MTRDFKIQHRCTTAAVMHVVYNAVSIQTGCRIDSTVASKTRVSPRCVGATTAAVREHQCSNVFVGVTCVHSNTTTVHPRDDWSCTKACTAIKSLHDADTVASHDGWVGNTPTSRLHLAREVLRNRSRRHSSPGGDVRTPNSRSPRCI